MKKTTLLASLFCFLFSASAFSQLISGQDSLTLDYSNPKEYEIGGITITGAGSLDNSVLLSIAGLYVGDKIKIPGESISSAIKNLWKEGFFEDVKVVATRVMGKTITLEIQVKERPRLSKFSFNGLKKGEIDDLKKKLDLNRGKVVTQNVLVNTKNRTLEHFRDKGYKNCTVIVSQEKDKELANSVVLYISVNKGSKVKIGDVNFFGNENVSSGTLRRAMKDTKQKRWYAIFNSHTLLETKYEDDKQKVIDKYLSKGFRDAKITSDTIYPVYSIEETELPDFVAPLYGKVIENGIAFYSLGHLIKKRSEGDLKNNRIAIDIHVSEGKKYYFRNITWVGNSKYSTRELDKALGIKKGDVFNQSLLDSRLTMNANATDVSSLYMDDGYLFFQVTPVEILVVGDSIDIEIRIYEGKQATINKVTVKGNTKTNDHVIMREIRTRPGQLFRRSDVIRSQRELSVLGYFDTEKMGVTPIPHPENGTVDIEYQVEEKSSDQLELSGGFGANRVVGSMGVAFNNFSAKNFFRKGAWQPLPSGDGQRLSVRGQSNGRYYQSLNMSFTEPWLGGKKPNSLSITPYVNRITNGRTKSDPQFGDLNIWGMDVGLGRRKKVPDDFFSELFEINYRYYVLKNYRSVFSFTNGFANDLNFKYSLSRNALDDNIYPGKNYTCSKLTFSAQSTLPVSGKLLKKYFFPDTAFSEMSAQQKYHWLEYYKLKITSEWFIKLTGKLVLMNRFGYGFLGFYNKELGLTPFERFYLGGSGLTGYNPLDGREIIALRGYDDGEVYNFSKPQNNPGASSIAKYTAELRYPLSLNPQATIFGLVFAEAGNSWGSIRDFKPFDVRRSAGVGIRFFLPMFGMLGFDYGWRFDDVPFRTGMQKSQFHFTIGYNLGEL
ncbi:MAG: outer membrane protein assembly factor BamA [Bacteroidetes bacterium]|nr:outer membrane protein assembly factor BamA [Bacteroidota bacterium]